MQADYAFDRASSPSGTNAVTTVDPLADLSSSRPPI